MKKFLLIIFTIFLILINVIIFGYGEEIISYYQLLFLNIENFPIFRLETYNFQYIICFCLFYNIIMYNVISDINESITFIYMIIYRINVIKTFKKMIKQCIIPLLKILLIVFFIILCAYLLTTNFKLIKFVDIILCLLYFGKYFIFILLVIMIYNFLSIIGYSNIGIFMTNIIFLLSLLMDLFLRTNIITFSSNLLLEIKYILFLGIMTMITAIVEIVLLKKKGDIL